MLVERSDRNPILIPDRTRSWEADSVFNGSPAKKGDDIYLAYRAISLPHYHSLVGQTLKVSEIGMARSKDGINFSDRKPFIIPSERWDRFGCEDPRVTKFGNKYYTFYTGLSEYPFRAEGIKVGVAISKDLETIEEKHLVTPFNAKAMAMFPEKIGGKIWTVLTVNTDKPPAHICLASFDKIEDMWNESKWNKWYKNFKKHSLNLQRRPQDHIEVGAQPIKTKHGWLLFYSYIKDYASHKQLFGIEAVLLDLKDPTKIVAKTDFPIMTPEEYYEKIGYIPDIIFPSGAIKISEDKAYLYYGAADTTCCVAIISLPDLLNKMVKEKMPIKYLWSDEKKIISANPKNDWEAKATFNPAAIRLADKVHILYRAMSKDNTSVVGYATSKNGVDIDYRHPEPIYVPREEFEAKNIPGGNSGCEDPRISKIGDKIYMFYTAYNGTTPPRVALTNITEKNFLQGKWDTWSKPVLISPPNFDDKDACVFPEKIKGKYFIIHRGGNDIDLSINDSLDFDGETWLEEYRWIAPRRGMWDSLKVGIAGPPIRTTRGWLVLYHGVSEDDHFYRVGAALADLNDPTNIIARTDRSILEPRMKWQKEGQVPNVVFPCGSVVINGEIYIYYGGADQVVGVAHMPLLKLLDIIDACQC